MEWFNATHFWSVGWNSSLTPQPLETIRSQLGLQSSWLPDYSSLLLFCRSFYQRTPSLSIDICVAGTAPNTWAEACHPTQPHEVSSSTILLLKMGTLRQRQSLSCLRMQCLVAYRTPGPCCLRTPTEHFFVQICCGHKLSNTVATRHRPLPSRGEK